MHVFHGPIPADPQVTARVVDAFTVADTEFVRTVVTSPRVLTMARHVATRTLQEASTAAMVASQWAETVTFLEASQAPTPGIV